MENLFTTSQFRPWHKLVGVNRYLTDGLVAIFSFLAINHQIFRVPICNFYNLAQKARAEFPEFDVSQQELFREMENALQLGVRISADLQHYEVPQYRAFLNIGRLRRRTSQLFLKKAAQIADFFSQQANLQQSVLSL